jgi:Bacterial extracellular solute-binding proteins, family 3.
VIEDTVATGYAAANPDLEFNTIPNTEESGSAIAFPKGSRLVPEFNRVLQQMKASGQIKELATKWFSRPIPQEPAQANQPPVAPKVRVRFWQNRAEFALYFVRALGNANFYLAVGISRIYLGNRPVSV